MSFEDKMGDTAGFPPDAILYTGSREQLQEKLRKRDDRITELESRDRLAVEALCKVATGRIGDGWATAEIQWGVCRDIAKIALSDLGVKID